MRTHIGNSSLLNNTPQCVEIDGKKYILNKSKDAKPILYESNCPHAGGTVRVENDDELICPVHDWEFDSETGESKTSTGHKLTSHEVMERNEQLYANVPRDTAIEFSAETSDKRPDITLVSHAALKIEYDGFTLLTDPWIEGAAFMRSWIHYPPTPYETEDIVDEVDAIWITHEHSDHLHIPTLEHFDAEIPVYVPDLNYHRLQQRVQEAGLENVHSLPTGKVYEIAEGIEAVCFESASVYNDSILALNFEGYKILNLQDAGINWEVHDAIPSVDLVASAFSSGYPESGYPHTWHTVPEDEKHEIVRARMEGMLEKAADMVEMFTPEHFFPCARFAELVQPDHQQYGQNVEVNRPRDVIDRLAGKDVQVIDLLPGESWNGDENEIHYHRNRDKWFNSETTKSTYLEEIYEDVQPLGESEFDLLHTELRTYFEELSHSELARQVGSHAFSMQLNGEERTLNALVQFEDGVVTYTQTDELVWFDTVDADYHVVMKAPGRRVQHVVRKDLSWDELHRGFWCEFWRASNDDYNLPFWRLIYAPWEAREKTMSVPERYDIETNLEGVSMATLVEDEQVEEILTQYGLYCVGCPNGLGEDILEAARIHGLDEGQAQELTAAIEQAAPVDARSD